VINTLVSAAGRTHAGTRPGVRPRCATLAAWGEADIYLLDKKETAQKIGTVTDLKVIVCKLCSIREISNCHTLCYYSI
jgi:hypothetical protein